MSRVMAMEGFDSLRRYALVVRNLNSRRQARWMREAARGGGQGILAGESAWRWRFIFGRFYSPRVQRVLLVFNWPANGHIKKKLKSTVRARARQKSGSPVFKTLAREMADPTLPKIVILSENPLSTWNSAVQYFEFCFENPNNTIPGQWYYSASVPFEIGSMKTSVNLCAYEYEAEIKIYVQQARMCVFLFPIFVRIDNRTHAAATGGGAPHDLQPDNPAPFPRTRVRHHIGR
jgi:hypothetical protein